MAAVKLSIVIPAYNEATYIDRLLEGLSNQNCEAFEVIVSDAESKDGTEEVVQQFSKKLNAKLLTSPPKGPAHGRNIGAAAAKGEWLLFLDADDDIRDPLFIKKLVSEAEQKECFRAGANSVFWGEKLLTTPNVPLEQDKLALGF